MIRRSIAIAVSLSPVARAIFADHRWGVNPNDEFRLYGTTVFVLSRPPRGGDATCVTIIVPTSAQLDTLDAIAESGGQCDVFCAALADFFNIRDAARIAHIRSVVVRPPEDLDALLGLLPHINTGSNASLSAVGARYFWGAYTTRAA